MKLARLLIKFNLKHGVRHTKVNIAKSIRSDNQARLIKMIVDEAEFGYHLNCMGRMK